MKRLLGRKYRCIKSIDFVGFDTSIFGAQLAVAQKQNFSTNNRVVILLRSQVAVPNLYFMLAIIGTHASNSSRLS